MTRRFVSLLLLLAATGGVGAAPVNAPLLLDAARAGDHLIAVGERGLIQHSDDDGTTWLNVPSSPATTTLCAVDFADARHGWAAGHGAVILRSTDGGRTWQHQFTGADPESPFLDLLALTPAHVIAVGDTGLEIELLRNLATQNYGTFVHVAGRK